MAAIAENPILYCICRQPDDGSLMIECGKCSEWYHARCVGIDPVVAESMKNYNCPRCKATTDKKKSEIRKRKTSYDDDEGFVVDDEEMLYSTKSNVKRIRTTTGPTRSTRRKKSHIVSEQSRDNVINLLRSALIKGFTNSHTEYDEETIGVVAREIEEGLYEAYGAENDGGDLYRQTALMIKSHLAEKNNTAFRSRLLDGSLPPKTLAKLREKEMLPENIKAQTEEKERINDELHLRSNENVILTNELLASSANAKSVINEEVSKSIQNLTAENVSAVVDYESYTAAFKWHGLLEKTSCATASCKVELTNEDFDTSVVIQRKISLGARVELNLLDDYLLKLSEQQSSRRLMILRLDPDEGHFENYKKIFQFFFNKKRAGVMRKPANCPTNYPLELYVIPISSNQPLPRFIENDSVFLNRTVFERPSVPGEEFLFLVLLSES